MDVSLNEEEEENDEKDKSEISASSSQPTNEGLKKKSKGSQAVRSLKRWGLNVVSWCDCCDFSSNSSLSPNTGASC